MEVTKKDKQGAPLVVGCAYGVKKVGSEDIGIFKGVVKVGDKGILEFDMLQINSPGMPPAKKVYSMDTEAEFELLFRPKTEEEVEVSNKDDLDTASVIMFMLLILAGVAMAWYAFQAVAINYELNKFIQR